MKRMTEAVKSTYTWEPLPAVDNLTQISPCCLETITSLEKHNDMMVCGHCNQLIKVFHEALGVRRFLTFCEGRDRPIQQGYHGGTWYLIYQVPT